MTAKRGYTRTIWGHQFQNKKVPLIAGLGVGLGVLGAWFLTNSFASTPTLSTQTESGTISSKASTVADTSASSGQAVKFGGSGGSGGGSGVCPAYPAFPDENCTGWQHTGVTLQTVPGQVTDGAGWEWNGSPFNYVKVTSSGAVLDGLDIKGCVYVDTGVKNVTIKRSRITGNCDYMVRLADMGGNSGLTISDTEIVGGAVQLKAAGYTWLRVNAHGFSGKAAMLESNSTVEDSYIHDNVCNPPDHQSAIGTNGGASNMIMRHNNVDLTPSECTSGGIANYDDFGAFNNVLIEKNLINSGGYCLKAGFEDNNALGSSGMRVLNNVFGRKYFAECGSFGVVSNWMAAVSGNQWSGNTWGSGAAATSAHATGDIANP